MLYVYYGEDIDAARKKVQATIANMLSKNPDALYFRITSDDLQDYNFDELTQSQALFKSEYIVLLDTAMETKEGEVTVLAHLEKIQEASHRFFILENKLLAPVRKKLEKHAESMQEFTSKRSAAKASFNTFSLTDALADRNVKKLWVLFREAKQHGVSDEEIYGILFWMFKSMLLAAHTKTAEEAGMKSFPYNKAKGALRHYGTTEHIAALTSAFVLLPQHARSSGGVLENELEKFILSL